MRLEPNIPDSEVTLERQAKVRRYRSLEITFKIWSFIQRAMEACKVLTGKQIIRIMALGVKSNTPSPKNHRYIFNSVGV